MADTLDPAALAQQGLVFQASTGDVQVPVAGGKLYLVLVNPVDSGRILQVLGVGANHYSIFTDLFAELNPSTATFSVTPVQSTNSGAPVAPAGVAYSGTITPPPDTPPNGVLLGRNLVNAPWLMNVFSPGLWVVPPGTSLGFVLYLYASSSAYTLGAVSVTWAELPPQLSVCAPPIIDP